MAKKKKRREADFSVEEMARLSDCNSEQTFRNRLKAVCTYYNIDENLFKMDEKSNGSESFFPAECGELIALLVRMYNINPGAKDTVNLDGVTAQSIHDFYDEILDEVDRLPEEVKNMVYSLPSHFTSNRIKIWIERLVPIMTEFILAYIDENGDDMGAFLQRLCVDIDKANYNMFWNYTFLKRVQKANEEYDKEHYAELLEFLYGDMDEKKKELESRLQFMNVSIDSAIADLIKCLMTEVSDYKAYILDQPDDLYNNMSREEYYASVVSRYSDFGRVNSMKDTLVRYTAGASGWKTIEDRIKEGNYVPEDVHITLESEIIYREERIKKLKQQLQEEEDELKRMKERGSEYENSRNETTMSTINMINQDYLEKCDRVRNEKKMLMNRTNKYVGQVIWEFLNKKQKDFFG